MSMMDDKKSNRFKSFLAKASRNLPSFLTCCETRGGVNSTSFVTGSTKMISWNLLDAIPSNTSSYFHGSLVNESKFMAEATNLFYLQTLKMIWTVFSAIIVAVNTMAIWDNLGESQMFSSCMCLKFWRWRMALELIVVTMQDLMKTQL